MAVRAMAVEAMVGVMGLVRAVVRTAAMAVGWRRL